MYRTTKDEDGFSFVSYKGRRKRKGNNKCSTQIFDDYEPVTLQNFDSVLNDIQDELKHSDFIVRFKEDLLNVLIEWDSQYLTDNQDSGNADSLILPDEYSATNKVVQSIDLICYGLGQFSSCTIARYQLGFLLVLKTMLHSEHVYIYDPQFSFEEINFLNKLGLNVLNVNEEAKRVLKRKSIFFMPHCDIPLYNNLLWANWNKDTLSELVIIGNSFQSYELNDAKRRLKERAKYVHLACKFVKEIRMTNVFRFSDIFNDLSIHYFTSASVSGIDPLLWSDLEEPEYTDDEEIIKRR